MSSVEIASTATEPVRLLWLADGVPVTGGAPTMRVRRKSDVFTTTLDFDAGLFAADADALQPYLAMSQVDATYAPGLYFRVFDATFPSNAVAPDIYAITFYADATLTTPIGTAEVRVGTVDTINSLPTGVDLLDAVNEIEGNTANGFAEIKGVGWTDADTLHEIAAFGAPPSAATIATQVNTTLAGIHGAGSWATATGFATAADVAASTAAIEAYGQAHWVTATGFATAGDVAAVPAAVWATAYGTPSANTFGWLAWRLAQWGTEIAQKRIVGQNLLLQSIGGGTTYATVPLKDISGGVIDPAPGEPAQYLP